MSKELDDLKELVLELADNLNQCMAQQAALQHGLYALMAHTHDKDAVAEALHICADSFTEHSEEIGLPPEMMEVYEDEISELIETLQPR
ncbi:MAG: hypothetical protein GX070_08590 [Alcaligenaceae bacterium]|nr:hypothetical protein [Alcaligenaceae bacterium]